MRAYFAFLASEARWLLFGLLLTFTSSLGQTFFISLFSQEIRGELGLGHAEFANYYAFGTIFGSVVLFWTGRLVDQVPLHLMAGFTLEVSQRDLIITGFLQGAGLGLVFVPVSALTYVTLAPHLRGDGTALFSLMRNLGSSIGVSLVMALLSRNMWINQQQLGARIQVPQELLETLPSTTELLGLPARAILEVTRQAAEIAYINNFELLT